MWQKFNKFDDYYEIDKYIFFWGSFYSQWAKYKIEIDEIIYNCC